MPGHVEFMGTEADAYCPAKSLRGSKPVAGALEVCRGYMGVKSILARKPRDVYRRIRDVVWGRSRRGRRLVFARSSPFVVAKVADFALYAGSPFSLRVGGEIQKYWKTRTIADRDAPHHRSYGSGDSRDMHG